jgi:acetyl-CoA C-acetyltransferase
VGPAGRGHGHALARNSRVSPRPEHGITREASDAYALESQRRASAALAAGRFTAEIVTVPVPGEAGRATGARAFERDEHPRGGTTLEGLRRLPPVFGDVDGVPGVVTAGTASGIADGGAAVVLATETAVRERNLRPLARIVGWATAGVDPRRMGIGPVPAVRRLLRQHGLGAAAFDLVELNEAFVAQVLAVQADLGFPVERLNVNGGAIALGHAIGCTGTRIVVTLLHELRRRGASRGLATLCVSGGLGVAMAFERV